MLRLRQPVLWTWNLRNGKRGREDKEQATKEKGNEPEKMPLWKP